jgi:hypothetical protein
MNTMALSLPIAKVTMVLVRGLLRVDDELGVYLNDGALLLA